MTWPNFLIIGAAKCGTTPMYHYLRQHPDVFMPSPKELRFFAFEGGVPAYQGPGDEQFQDAVTDPGDYEACFAAAEGVEAIGEASPLYLYVPEAAERIRRYLPRVRLIAMLRDPASRAYSQYLHMVRLGHEPHEDFAEALRAEPERIEQGWGPLFHYRARGFYAEQLQRYCDRFGREQMRVYLYEDFARDQVAMVQDVFRLLGVADRFVPHPPKIRNVSGVPRSRALHSIVQGRYPRLSALARTVLPAGVRLRFRKVLREKILTRPPLDPETRRDLVKGYREDILRLQEMLGRDLSAWLR